MAQTNTSSINFLGYSGYGYLITSTTNNSDTYTVIWTAGFHNNSYFYKGGSYVYATISGTDQSSHTYSYSTNSKVAAGDHTIASNGYYSWSKGTSAASKTVSCGVSFNGSSGTTTQSFTIPALSSYILTLDPSPGAGGGSITGYYNKVYSTTGYTATRAGYTFNGWSGGTSWTANGDATWTSLWKINSYTLSLSANGGVAGSIVSLSADYGNNITLPSNIEDVPTRVNYNLLGWSTDPNAVVATYAVGGTYPSITTDVMLYAVWEIAYIAPTPTVLTATRCNSSGEEDAEGTYATIGYSFYSASNGSNVSNSTNVSIQYKLSTDTVYNNFANFTITGEYSENSPYSENRFSNQVIFAIDSKYDIKLTLTDSSTTGSGSSTISTFISTTYFPLDISGDGKSFGIGAVAENAPSGQENTWAGLFKLNLPLKVLQSASFNSSAQFNGDMNIMGNCLINGATTNKFECNPPAQFNGDITTTGNMDITGNCLINGANIVDSGKVTYTDNPGYGYWIRLYDGTQICWRYGTTTNFSATNTYGSLYQGTMKFDYPRAFVGDDPIVSPCIARYDTGAAWASYASSSLTSTSIRMFDVISRPTGGTTEYGFIVIGRWK